VYSQLQWRYQYLYVSLTQLSLNNSQYTTKLTSPQRYFLAIFVPLLLALSFRLNLRYSQHTHITIAELVELIALYFEYHDFSRAQSVSSFWCCVITTSSKLVRLLHKPLVLIEGENNPHLDQATVATRNACIAHDQHVGEPHPRALSTTNHILFPEYATVLEPHRTKLDLLW
jgi:hypothetical protein